MAPIVNLILFYRYWILFPLACFEGPILAFVVGALCALGYFDVLPAYGVLLLGDLVPDIAYYFIGRFGERSAFITRYSQKIRIKKEHVDVIRRFWLEHPWKTMLFSKLAYGLSTALLISAGVAGLPFKKFFASAFPITLAQYGLFLFLGYYFSNSFRVVSHSLFGVGILVAGVIIVAVAYYFFGTYVRRRFDDLT